MSKKIKATLKGLFPTASKAGIEQLSNILDPCCPIPSVEGMRWWRDVYLVPANGTTNFTLTYTPIFPEIVIRNGSVLLPYEYSISGNILTLVNPITNSVGGEGAEDIMVIYPY